MTDPIADMLTRIRNAQMARKADVFMPFSKIKFGIAQILVKEGYLESADKVDGAQFPELKLVLKYDNDQKPAIQNIQRVSRVGRRVFSPKDSLPRVLNGYGFAVISTSKGLLTDNEARKAGVGGEIICEVY
jgi:small subunit ribosomal protein S8